MGARPNREDAAEVQGLSRLEQWFENHKGRFIEKWSHYFEIYERHFERFRGTAPLVVEIGCGHGGSLDMWKAYFGPETRIVGVDVDERKKMLEGDGIEIVIGDQGDVAFLEALTHRFPRPDVVIDDGGHRMEQQRASFDALYPWVSDNGVYLCEDLHTSYWSSFGGGYRKAGSFVEFAKGLVDSLNADHVRGIEADAIAATTHSIHFYDSIVVFEKRLRTAPPHPVHAGTRVAELRDPE